MVKINPELERKLRKGFRKVERVLSAISTIVDKLPEKGDTPLQIGLKSLAVTGLLLQFRPKGETLDPVIIDLNLVEDRDNDFMAEIFFFTKISSIFHTSLIKLEDGRVMTYAQNEALGNLLFSGTKEEHGMFFYHSKGFDFEGFREKIWELYEGHIQYQLEPEKPPIYSKFAPIPNPLFARDKEKMEMLVARHRRCQVKGMSVTYMFYGPAGAGKTSFALEFAQRIGGKTLRIDTKAFSELNGAMLLFFLDAFQPDFLLVDDFDKLHEAHLGTILNILQEVRQQGRTSVLLTSNIVSNFDQGLLRPGRINCWVEFPTPSNEERQIVLLSYLKEAGIILTVEEMDELLESTEGLTYDYVRDAVERLGYLPFADAVREINEMRTLLETSRASREDPTWTYKSEPSDPSEDEEEVFE